MAIRTLPIEPLSSADWLGQFADLDSTYWETFSGATRTFDRPMHTDGYSAKQRRARNGTSMIEDVTMTKSFDPNYAPDVALLRYLESLHGGDYFEVEVSPVTRQDDLAQRGSITWQLHRCRLLSYTDPASWDVNQGANLYTLSVTFSVEDVTKNFAGASEVANLI